MLGEGVEGVVGDGWGRGKSAWLAMQVRRGCAGWGGTSWRESWDAGCWWGGAGGDGCVVVWWCEREIGAYKEVFVLSKAVCSITQNFDGNFHRFYLIHLFSFILIHGDDDDW